MVEKKLTQQEWIPVGCVPSAAVTVSGVSCLWGVSAWGYLPKWGVHPLVNRMTDMCKNITFPQLRLRTVKTSLD